MRIVSIVGARPEFVQSVPVSRALQGRHEEFLGSGEPLLLTGRNSVAPWTKPSTMAWMISNTSS